MCLSENKENNVYPCKPHFSLNKMRLSRVFITQTSLRNDVIIRFSHSIELCFKADITQRVCLLNVCPALYSVSSEDHYVNIPM